jgi:hypothetical protein
VAEQESVPPGPDTRIPNMARMYDYALGGKDNFAADREAVQKLFSFAPENRDVPRANRRFLGRAVRFAADQGVRSFSTWAPVCPARATSMKWSARSTRTCPG